MKETEIKEKQAGKSVITPDVTVETMEKSKSKSQDEPLTDPKVVINGA